MKPERAPLGRSSSTDVLDWHEVDRKDEHRAVDVFGLGEKDRIALGMSQARAFDAAPHLAGDAHAALADALAKGAAVGKRDAKRARK